MVDGEYHSTWTFIVKRGEWCSTNYFEIIVKKDVLKGIQEIPNEFQA